MKFTGYYIALFALTLDLTASADMTQPDHYLMSPNATSLGEYGAVPVSLFTGIPEISIPITEVSAGSHTLPISLSYHGGGVRPDQHPGWVGLGWTLNAGGCVSRIVNGIPDETFYYNVNDNLPAIYKHDRVRKYGFFFNGAENGSDVFPILADEEPLHIIREVETLPDMFVFDFCGIQGKFYYNTGGHWIVQSDRDIRVVFDIANQSNYWSGLFDGGFDTNESTFKFTRSKVINNFKIIDEYGNTYFFGGNKDAVEYSVGFFSQRSEQPAATTWHLTRIEYADGNLITFDYQKKDYVIQLGVSENWYEIQIPKDNKINYTYYNGEQIVKKQDATIDIGRGYVNGSLISPSYLKSINTLNSTLEFNINESKELPYYPEILSNIHYNKTPIVRDEYTYCENFDVYGNFALSQGIRFEKVKFYKLTEITLKNASKETIRSFSFSYNDFENYKSRLVLKSIKDNFLNKTYSFEYNDVDDLPFYCSYNIDHWGFYKNTGIVNWNINWDRKTYPAISRHINISNVSYEDARKAYLNDAIKGSLEKIIYPTGGYTRFKYELNTFHCMVDSTHSSLIELDQPMSGGGIRVEKIYSSDTGEIADEKLDREFEYYDPFSDVKKKSSSGVLLRPWNYSIVLKSKDNDFQSTIPYNVNIIARTSGNINPINNYSESACVTYSWVKEKLPDGSYSIYNYSNYDNGYPDGIAPGVKVSGIRINIPYSSNSPKRGLLLAKYDYTSDNSLIKSENLHYVSSPLTSIRVVDNPVYEFSYTETLSPTITDEVKGKILAFHTFKIPTYTMRPDSITTTEYLDSKPTVEQTVTTTYHRGNLPEEETVSLSSGEKTRTKYTYLDDLEDSDAGEILRASHKVGILRSKKNYLIDSNNQSYLTDFVRYGYKDSSPVYPDTIIAGYGDPDIFETTRHKFDSRYNITEIESDGAAPAVFVWGYNRSYPVAKIVNAHIADVEAVIGDIEQFSLTPEPNFAKLESLRAALPSASVWIYRFKPLVGLVEVTDPSGNAVKYSYDKAGRLSGIKDVDGHFTDVFDYNYAR